MNLKTLESALVALCLAIPANGQTLRSDINLSDPFVMADTASGKYYMTGTGGRLWESSDLQTWEGPKDIVHTPSDSWMGSSPQVWASELYGRDGYYYDISTFTNNSTTIDDKGHPRRAVHILRSDMPDGQYTLIPQGDAVYLPASKCTLDGTLFEDSDGSRYLVYCHE